MEETKDTKGTKKVATKKTTTKATNAKTTKTTAKKTTKVAPKTIKAEVKNVEEVTKKDIEFSAQEVNAFSVISFTLGIVSLIAWAYPIFGVSIAIPGLVLGILSRAFTKSSSSLLGSIMCLIGIVLSIVRYIA